MLIATETSVIPNSSVIPTCLYSVFLRLSKLEVSFASILSSNPFVAGVFFAPILAAGCFFSPVCFLRRS